MSDGLANTDILMTKMFISHTWSEDAQYQRFGNDVFGAGSWINLSIPQDAAIDLVREEARLRED